MPSTPSWKASRSPASRRRACSPLPRRKALPVKLHADQLSNLGGAALAAKHGALSADHLEYTDEAGAAAMAKAGTVAVILPGAFYYLRETRKPPIEHFRKHGVAMAVSTDANPGSSPILSLRLTMNMACILFHLDGRGGDPRRHPQCREGAWPQRHRCAEGGREVRSCRVGCDVACQPLVYEMGSNPLHARVYSRRDRPTGGHDRSSIVLKPGCGIARRTGRAG